MLRYCSVDCSGTNSLWLQDFLFLPRQEESYSSFPFEYAALKSNWTNSNRAKNFGSYNVLKKSGIWVFCLGFLFDWFLLLSKKTCLSYLQLLKFGFKWNKTQTELVPDLDFQNSNPAKQFYKLQINSLLLGGCFSIYLSYVLPLLDTWQE